METKQSTYIWKKPGEAENYSQSRPQHPSDVVNLSLKYLREKYQGPLQLALDIGCGTGKSTEHLLPHFEKVYGCDLSQAMLDQATKDYEHCKNVTFVQSTAEDLSQFPTNAFQLIIAGRYFFFFNQKLYQVSNFKQIDFFSLLDVFITLILSSFLLKWIDYCNLVVFWFTTRELNRISCSCPILTLV